MNTENSSIFDLASKRLQWLSTRQKVVSENIANSDVTGYRAKDIQGFESYLDKARNSAQLPEAQVIEAQVDWSSNMSGNNVVLEEQIMEANATAGQFRIAANLYRKAYDMLHTVAGRR